MKRVFEGRFALVDSTFDSTGEHVREVVRTRAGQFSVGFLIYDPVTDSVILCEQERPAMITDENLIGYIVEVPAGRCDKQHENVLTTMAREAREEVGALIHEDQIELINNGVPLALSPGIVDELMYLAYIELRPGQLSADRRFGEPEEGEDIVRKLIPAAQACNMVCVDIKTKALLLDFQRRQAIKSAAELQQRLSA